jgi:hypothetical protein
MAHMVILAGVCLIVLLQQMMYMLANKNLYVYLLKIVLMVHMVILSCINVLSFVQFNQILLQMNKPKNVYLLVILYLLII